MAVERSLNNVVDLHLSSHPGMGDPARIAYHVCHVQLEIDA